MEKEFTMDDLKQTFDVENSSVKKVLRKGFEFNFKLLFYICVSFTASTFLMRENSLYFDKFSDANDLPMLLAVLLELFFTLFSVSRPKSGSERIISNATLALIFLFSIFVSLSTVYSEYSVKSNTSKALFSEKSRLENSLKENMRITAYYAKEKWAGNHRKSTKEGRVIRDRLADIEQKMASKGLTSQNELLVGLAIMVFIRLIFQMGNLVVNRRIGNILYYEAGIGRSRLEVENKVH